MAASIADLRTLNDCAIAERYIATGRGIYFDEIYRRYSDKVFAKCLTLLKEPELARDAMQDVFIKILTRISSFNRQSMFSTWIYAVTYNYCIDNIRRNKRSPLSAMADDRLAASMPFDTSEQEGRMLFEEEYARVNAALELIPSDDRSVLIMKYQDDLSIKEICSALAKSESAVKMKLLRAKQKVLDRMEVN